MKVKRRPLDVRKTKRFTGKMIVMFKIVETHVANHIISSYNKYILYVLYDYHLGLCLNNRSKGHVSFIYFLIHEGNSILVVVLSKYESYF